MTTVTQDSQVDRHSPAAYVGTVSLAIVDPVELRERIQAHLHEEVAIRHGKQEALDAFLIAVGADKLPYVVIPVTGAVPPEDLRTAVQAAYGWRQAQAAVVRSRAHYIVASLSVVDRASAVEDARRLTQLVAALLDVVPAEYVYWQAGDVITEPAAFRAGAVRMVETGSPPVLSWIQFRLLPGHGVGKSGIVGAVTTGLTPIIGRELEIEPSLPDPMSAIRLAAGLAAHLLHEGNAFGNGDTASVPGAGEVSFALLDRGRVVTGPVIQVRALEGVA